MYTFFILNFVVICTVVILVDGKFEFGLLTASTNTTEDSYCLIYAPSDVEYASSKHDALSTPFLNLIPWNGCDNDTLPNEKRSQIPRSTVAILGGNCSVHQKYSIIQNLGGVGIIIISSSPSREMQATNASELHDIAMPLGIMYEKSFFEIQEMGQEVSVKLFIPQSFHYVNFSLLIIGIIATFSIVAGALYTPSRRNKMFSLGSSHFSDTNDKSEAQFLCLVRCNNIAMAVISIFIILFNVIIFIGTILALYYFFDKVVYVFIAIFCFASAICLFWLALPVLHYFPCGSFRVRIYIPKLCRFFIEIREIILLICAMAISITWGIFRHEDFMWILQDILGIAFCVTFISRQRVPNLKICTFILVGFLIYDVFAVYITPLFTGDGKSVMERIAIGESKQENVPSEQMPTLLRVPYYSHNPLRMCFEGAYFILGFGDIIIPGILVSLCHDFGFKNYSWNIYFPVVVVGYVCGLIATDIALEIMETGQPALFFLVPCTLLPVVITGYIRKELNSLWSGLPKCPEINGQLYSEVKQLEDSSVSSGSELNCDELEMQEKV